MPRTTLDIDAGVLRELKKRGRREGKSLGRLVSELVAASLSREEDEPSPALEWTSKSMDQRVDLEDKEAVYRALEDR